MAYPILDLGDWDDDMGDQGAPGGGVTSGQLAAAVAGLAPGNAKYVTLGSESGLTNESSLGALTDGILYNDVTAGVGSLRPAVGADLPAHNHTGVVVGAAFLIDGGGATITTGIKGDLPPMPFAGNITGYALLSDQSGSIVVAAWKDTMANFPPVVGDLVLTMTLTTNTRVPTSGDYTSVTAIPFAAGDVFRFNVNSVTSCQRVTIGLRITRDI